MKGQVTIMRFKWRRAWGCMAEEEVKGGKTNIYTQFYKVTHMPLVMFPVLLYIKRFWVPPLNSDKQTKQNRT